MIGLFIMPPLGAFSFTLVCPSIQEFCLSHSSENTRGRDNGEKVVASVSYGYISSFYLFCFIVFVFCYFIEIMSVIWNVYLEMNLELIYRLILSSTMYVIYEIHD